MGCKRTYRPQPVALVFGVIDLSINKIIHYKAESHIRELKVCELSVRVYFQFAYKRFGLVVNYCVYGYNSKHLCIDLLDDLVLPVVDMIRRENHKVAERNHICINVKDRKTIIQLQSRKGREIESERAGV